MNTRLVCIQSNITTKFTYLMLFLNFKYEEVIIPKDIVLFEIYKIYFHISNLKNEYTILYDGSY